MAFTKSHRTPVQLTADARAAARAVLDRYEITRYLPSRDTYALSFSFDVNAMSLPAAASFRSFNTAADVGTTDGTASRAGKLPPISRRLHVDEFAELTLFNQGAAVGEKFKEYAQRIATQIAARVVLAQGEAVRTGKVTLAERGLTAEIDYGRKAAHTANAASGWWSVAGTATPIADLEAARTVFGVRPDVTWISPEILSALQKNTDIIKMVLGRGTDLPSRVSAQDVIALLGSEGFGRLVVNDDQLVDVNGATKRVIDANHLLFLPDPSLAPIGGSGALGRTDWGVTAESISTETGITDAERPGVFAGALPTHDPEGFDVLVSAIVLPVVDNANASFALKVLNA